MPGYHGRLELTWTNKDLRLWRTRMETMSGSHRPTIALPRFVCFTMREQSETLPVTKTARKTIS